MNAPSSKRLMFVVSTALLTAAYLAGPLASDPSHLFGPGKALAGNGNGNGGGNGNGHAGGNGNGGGNGNAGGNANGNAANNSHPENHGAVASSLGALNAAHASSTALANAAPNSEVGRIHAYQVALDNYLTDLQNHPLDTDLLDADIAAVGDALGAAANKTVTPSTVDRLNDLLGISTDSDLNWDATKDSIVSEANGS
jgi:hypothetical protein